MSEWRICASIQCVFRCTNPELLTHRDMFSCQENAFENVVCKTAAILCCFQCINSHWCPFSQTCSMATGITKRDLAIPPSAATMAWHPDKPLAFVLHNVYSKQVKGWRNQMETFPRYWSFVGGIHRSPVDSPHKGPVTRSFDVFFDLRLNTRLSKQSRRRWFKTPSRSSWRHCNEGWLLSIYSHPMQSTRTISNDIRVLDAHIMVKWRHIAS